MNKSTIFYCRIKFAILIKLHLFLIGSSCGYHEIDISSQSSKSNLEEAQDLFIVSSGFASCPNGRSPLGTHFYKKFYQAFAPAINTNVIRSDAKIVLSCFTKSLPTLSYLLTELGALNGGDSVAVPPDAIVASNASVNEFLNFLASFYTNNQNIKNVYIIGHSWGGALALRSIEKIFSSNVISVLKVVFTLDPIEVGKVWPPSKSESGNSGRFLSSAIWHNYYGNAKLLIRSRAYTYENPYDGVAADNSEKDQKLPLNHQQIERHLPLFEEFKSQIVISNRE
ncbi:MAG: hypothetical protein KBD78_14645 [Oligoflexales bacterium]|nr:hypothetical protein [Oligoflexales bacterium]